MRSLEWLRNLDRHILYEKKKKTLQGSFYDCTQFWIKTTWLPAWLISWSAAAFWLAVYLGSREVVSYMTITVIFSGVFFWKSKMHPFAIHPPDCKETKLVHSCPLHTVTLLASQKNGIFLQSPYFTEGQISFLTFFIQLPLSTPPPFHQ